MLLNCDCGTCCDACGHYPECIRFERMDVEEAA